MTDRPDPQFNLEQALAALEKKMAASRKQHAEWYARSQARQARTAALQTSNRQAMRAFLQEEFDVDRSLSDDATLAELQRKAPPPHAS